MMRYSEILINQNLCDCKPVAFGYENCKASHSYGPAVRSYWLLHYVVSGKGKFVREDKSHQLSKGDLFVIPPYLETYYEADSEDPWNYIWIGFSLEGEIPPQLLQPILHCPEVERIFEEMKLCSRKNEGKNSYLLAKLWELFSTFSDRGKIKTGYVENALLYMKNEYMNNISVADLAQRLGLDRSYFSNIFKAEIGISPAKYLSNLRLANASELLIKHGMSPTTAAFSSGYSDIFHFSKAFKKHFGVSPRAYQKQYAKKR